MKNSNRYACNSKFLGFVAVIVCALSAFPILASGQGGQGQNAVYPASGTCCVGSAAFIDASMFATNPPPPRDLCNVLNWVLTHGYPSTGAVIDARGLNSGNTSMTCSASPWAGITNPSTILLPAGAIVIPTTWALPNNTRLIGEGDGIPSSGFTPGTTIQAVANNFTDSSMIQFGASAGLCLPPPGTLSVCGGISVEKLTLDGQGQSLNGITNQLAGVQSYVDHVSLYRILGTGLSVSQGANDSGPYSNITFDLGGVSGTQQTVCASINGLLTGTRGIHGLTCLAENNDPPAAVLLDSSNNSIEDVRIVGFYDGILVGSHASAQSNVLLNIVGDTGREGIQPPVHVVHISSNNSVTDLSMMGVNNVLGNPINGEYSIEDDVTSTTLGDVYVAVYALGEGASGGHSRFTTSPNAASWASGSSAPNGTCAAGSLYSNTGVNSTTPHALYVCSVNTNTWLEVK